MDRFKKDLLTALNVRLALLTEDALQVYVVAQTFARDKKSPTLEALVANMKRDLGRAEARRKFNAKKAADKAAAEKAAAEKAGVKAATSTNAS